MELKTAIEHFYHAMEGTVSERTLQWYRQRLAPLESLANKDIASITTNDLREIYTGLLHKGTYSPHTLHGFIRAWRRLFRWIYREGHIPTNPADRLRFPPLPQEPPKGINDNDLPKLLAACKNDQHRALILFLADTGARLGGVLRLRREDLDIASRRALVREKGNKARYVYFGEATVTALQKWLNSRTDDDPRVFLLGADGVRSMLKRCARRAGLSGRWNPHAFRHGFARRILANGGNLAQVSQLMGHSTIYVTAQFYGRFATKELQEFHSRYNKLPITIEDE